MSFRNTCWFLGIAVGGAISLAANSASAQITSDTTLPNNSIVTINGKTFNIDGGTTAGRNLFHSFQQFSVPTDNTASFNNAADIQNIFSRVTGESGSNIDGIIKANAPANLFLINPKGIIFGKNARLDVGGSFVGTTANAIQFGNQGFFSASAPNNPALLTVNPSALFFNQIAAASITNNSVADAGLNPSSSFTATGLRVPDGKSLLLVGGDINMDGGRLYAFGGRVELGGLASGGTVGLNGDGSNLSLSFPDGVERSDVFLSNGAQVRVTAGDGGSIAVKARNLEMTDGSYLYAGIERGLGSDNSKAGNIEVNAQGTLNLKDNSNISNSVQSGATGQAGDININTGSLTLSNGAELRTSTYGSGKAGNVNINARERIYFDRGFVFSTLQPRASGKSGDIIINTGSLALINGAELVATSYGQGDAGNVNIDARDTVSFDGRDSRGYPSGAFSNVESENAVGNGGDININTGSLYLSNGAVINSRTRGQGNAGSVNIKARETVSFDRSSSALSSVESTGVGNGGDIKITTGSLYLSNGAEVNARTRGQGNGGDINIKTGSLALTNGSELLATTSGRGNAGNVNIDARDTVSFDRSYARSSVLSMGVGKGGDIKITTGSLALMNGGELIATTYGRGDAGNVNINARDTVSFDGFDAVYSKTPSGAFSNVESEKAVGNGGVININTGSLYLRNGAVVNSRTRGQGNGGSVKINARDTVSFDRSNATSEVRSTGVGNGGDITITTKLLEVLNGARLSATTEANNNAAGNIDVEANSIRLDQGTISADTKAGQGNIELRSRDLILFRGSQITTNATGSNVIGGNINIDTDVLAAVEKSNISTDSADARGGRVIINTQGLFRSPDSTITARGANPQLNGIVQINTPDIDPSHGLVSLPVDVLDPSKQIAQGCSAFDQATASDFKVTGRGGLPPSPDEPLSSDAVWEDTRLGATTAQRLDSKTTATKPKSESDTVQIIPATGWVFNGKGEVTLVSHTPNATAENLAASSQSCHVR
ncbi:MAG: filamentous hemagglutinin N-terminal domain-containing protein [Scytonema sp. RU_4_4]|nr:filamentous hemagglutinin N-terminal domain-containing protein [Scytonema sp. RU_4_4]